jgi:hypothetical protein
MLRHFYFRLVPPQLGKRYAQCRSIHIMAGILMFVYTLFFIEKFSQNWMQLLAMAPPALVIIALAIFKKEIIVDAQNNRIFRILEAGILLMGAIGFLQKDHIGPTILFGLFAVFLLIILYIENRLFTSQYIDVTENGISIALPTHDKKMEWALLKNIIVKGDYFTVEDADGAIRQYPIVNSLNEEEFIQFNYFCAKYLSRQ